MKTIFMLFLAAILSFTGLAVHDHRVRSLALEKAFAAREQEVEEQHAKPTASPAEKAAPSRVVYQDSIHWDQMNITTDDVRNHLGSPLSTARDHYGGGEIWGYADLIILFNTHGKVAEVTRTDPTSR